MNGDAAPINIESGDIIVIPHGASLNLSNTAKREAVDLVEVLPCISHFGENRD